MSLMHRLIHRQRHRAARGTRSSHGSHGPHGSHGADGAHRAHDAHGAPDAHGADGAHGPHDEEGRFAGENAERYAQRSRSLARFYRSTARSLVALAPDGGHVVDIGTGPGDLLLELATARPDLTVTGIDLEPDMVAIADRAARTAGLAPRVRALEGDVAALPLETDSVDVVVATLTLHHWPDVPAGLAEIARVLRPGGAVLIVDFGGDIERGLRAELGVAVPGATLRRRRRWAWGLPAFVATEVRLPAA